MPSFDIVSEVDLHEVANAVDQAMREVGTRFDFKGSLASCELKEGEIRLVAESDFQLQQLRDILNSKLAKRHVDAGSLERGAVTPVGKEFRQSLKLKQGVETAYAKELIKLLKESKIKVQASIQGEQVRVTGKKRDDLQEAIALLRSSQPSQPLQYINFRD